MMKGKKSEAIKAQGTYILVNSCNVMYVNEELLTKNEPGTIL